MQKKMLIIISTIVVLFIALYFVIDYKNDKAIDNSDNPYGTTDLDQATIDQLDNPDYKNQILPDELAEKLDNKEDVVVYFYSPTCPHCQKTTPYLVDLTEEMDVDMKKLNLLEFDVPQYKVQYTPTLIYFEDGVEVDRVTGGQSKELFRAFFNEYVVDVKAS